MPIEIINTGALPLVEMRLDGEVTCEDLRNTIDELMQIRERHGINRILVDTEDLVLGPPFFEYFALVCELPQKLVFATYAIGRQKLSEVLQFGETVAYNRCRAVRHFDDREAALQWLLQRR